MWADYNQGIMILLIRMGQECDTSIKSEYKTQ